MTPNRTPPHNKSSTQLAQALTSSTRETLCVASNTQASDDGVRVDGKVWMKLDLLILPLVTVMAFVYLLDSSNIGNARIAGFMTDMNISNEKFSVAMSLALLPTILLQIPATHLMLYIGARYQLSAMAILTGIAVMLQGVLPGFGAFVACRVLIGVFSSCILSGLDFHLTTFYPRRMFQFRLSIFSIAVPLSSAFSGLLAYPITRMDGIYGKPGWAWLFILEGGLAIFWGLVCLLLMPNNVAQVFVLTESEKQLIRRALEQDQLSHKLDSHGNLWRNMRSTLVRPYVLLISLASFFMGVAFIGFVIFLPTVVVGLGYDSSEAQLMSVPPYAIAIVVSLSSSFISDRYAIRGPIIAVLAILSTAGLAVYIGSESDHVRYGAFLLAVPCVLAIQPALPAWVANNTPQMACRVIAVSCVSLSAVFGSILSLWLFGPISSPPKYASATVTIMVFHVGILGCAAGTMVYVVKENRKKARAREAYASAQMKNGAEGVILAEEDRGEMTNTSIWFEYVL
ncbi:MFS general substrate transporter [Fomes fomentarius]|nr:MFS general substrate transporter [Fomes fomentarius]